MMSTRLLASSLVACLALSLPVAAQQIKVLDPGTWATDITPDGEIVVGSAPGGSFLWRWRVDPSPTLIPGGYAVAVSDDGTVIAGTINDPVENADVAAIWTAATGWQSLGWLPGALSCPSKSNAYDISGDGTVVVGLSWEGCDGRGFRWTAATGMQELQALGPGTFGHHNRCTAISGNGSALGGFAQGNFSRTPAYWAPNTSGYVLDNNFQGEVLGFDEYGTKSVGTNYFGGSNYEAFLRDDQSGVMTNLGNLIPGWGGYASDLSEDYQTIVGYDVNMLARKAWVWKAGEGIKSLNDRLTTLGVTGLPDLQVCTACSDDGNVIVGGATSATFFGAGFIAELETPQPQWTNLGFGLAGSTGIPVLQGTGPLTANSATTVKVSNGKPNSLAVFVVGLNTIIVSFKQGILVPYPTVLFTVPALSPAGSAALQFAYPTGLPVGLPLYWQVAIKDSAAPAGYALSNALVGYSQ